MPASRLTGRRSTPTSPQCAAAGTLSTICRSCLTGLRQAWHRPTGLRPIFFRTSPLLANRVGSASSSSRPGGVCCLGAGQPGRLPCLSAEIRFRPRSPPGLPLCRSLDRQRAILSPVLAISVVLAVLRGGCRRRHRRDDRHCTVLGAHKSAAAVLKLRLLRAVLLSATELLPSRVLCAADLLLRTTPSRPGSRRWDWLIKSIRQALPILLLSRQ